MTSPHPLLVIALVELLCIVGCAADYYLKLAGQQPGLLLNRPFLVGFALHSSTAIGWYVALKYLDLSQVGVIYSVSIVLLLALVGVLFFGETLGLREYSGIALAVGALLLMVKFQ